MTSVQAMSQSHLITQKIYSKWNETFKWTVYSGRKEGEKLKAAAKPVTPENFIFLFPNKICRLV